MSRSYGRIGREGAARDGNNGPHQHQYLAGIPREYGTSNRTKIYSPCGLSLGFNGQPIKVSVCRESNTVVRSNHSKQVGRSIVTLARGNTIAISSRQNLPRCLGKNLTNEQNAFPVLHHVAKLGCIHGLQIASLRLPLPVRLLHTFLPCTPRSVAPTREKSAGGEQALHANGVASKGRRGRKFRGRDRFQSSFRTTNDELYILEIGVK